VSRRHVVLLTYGEPPDPSFTRHFAYSWRILFGLTRLVAPIPAAVVPAIALRRALQRTSMWRAEDYGSPIEAITAQQADGLAAALAARAPGTEWRVHVAYEFRPPLLPDVLGALPADEPVSVVPMYLADSEFTHELSRRRLAARAGGAEVVPALDADRLAELSARHVERELVRRRVEVGRDWALVLAAHGTLVRPPRPMNTGREATERVAQGIARRLEGRFGRVVWGWLNHVMGGEWTQPAADLAVRALADEGFRKVVYFPYGFVADNAESQLEGRILLRAERRLETVVHLPCLNAAPGYLDAIADAVLDHGIVGARQERDARGA
jgi:ferrochelatase